MTERRLRVDQAEALDECVNLEAQSLDELDRRTVAAPEDVPVVPNLGANRHATRRELRADQFPAE